MLTIFNLDSIQINFFKTKKHILYVVGYNYIFFSGTKRAKKKKQKTNRTSNKIPEPLKEQEFDFLHLLT